MRDRSLAELFSAIFRRWESLPPEERTFLLADLWAAGGSGLRAQGPALRTQRAELKAIVAWLGWQPINTPPH